MRRLTAKNVFSGLVTAWRLAGWPVSLTPSSVKATIDGVVGIPSAFSMTLGVLPSITATHELVVPRSIPMTLPMVFPLFAAGRTGLFSAREGSVRPARKPPIQPLRIRTARRPRRAQWLLYEGPLRLQHTRA